MRRNLGYKGQIAMEYAVVLIIVIGALIAMQMYLKRGVQGRYKSSIDSVGEQYDPLTTTTDITESLQGSSSTAVTVDNATVGKETLRNESSSITQTKTGTTSTYSH